MQVGDRDDVQEDGTNFTPRIVRFAGLHPLPAGERWGYPSGLAEYPLAAFHFTGDAATEGFTLCFEDRDGIRGLHHRYDRQAAQEATCQRITLSLRLAPHEFESLFTPGTGMRRPAFGIPARHRGRGKSAPRSMPSKATTRRRHRPDAPSHA